MRMKKSIFLLCVALCSLESSGNPVGFETSSRKQNGMVTQLTEPESSSPAPAHCATGYRYSSEANSCYKFHKEYVSWPVANETCVMEGAHLAVVTSLEEADISWMGHDVERANNWVWMGLGIKVGVDYLVWVGVYRDSEGRWKTVTGESPVAAEGFPVWGGTPWGGDEWRYAALGKKGYLYNELANSNGFPFICERAP